MTSLIHFLRNSPSLKGLPLLEQRESWQERLNSLAGLAVQTHVAEQTVLVYSVYQLAFVLANFRSLCYGTHSVDAHCIIGIIGIIGIQSCLFAK